MQIRVNGYSNPTGLCHQVDQVCNNLTQRQIIGDNPRCCDAECLATNCATREDKSDSYFVYCLRPFGEHRQDGCFENETRTTSNVNEDDGLIDFSQSIVLGLDNPQNLSGLDEAYKVSGS